MATVAMREVSDAWTIAVPVMMKIGAEMMLIRDNKDK